MPKGSSSAALRNRQEGEAANPSYRFSAPLPAEPAAHLSRAQLAWNLIVLGLCYLLLHRLNAAFAPGGLLCGAAGALGVQYERAPCGHDDAGRGKSDVTLLLKRSG